MEQNVGFNFKCDRRRQKKKCLTCCMGKACRILAVQGNILCKDEILVITVHIIFGATMSGRLSFRSSNATQATDTAPLTLLLRHRAQVTPGRLRDSASPTSPLSTTFRSNDEDIQARNPLPACFPDYFGNGSIYTFCWCLLQEVRPTSDKYVNWMAI